MVIIGLCYFIDQNQPATTALEMAVYNRTLGFNFSDNCLDKTRTFGAQIPVSYVCPSLPVTLHARELDWLPRLKPR